MTSGDGRGRGDDLEAPGKHLEVAPTRLRGSGGGRGRGIVALASIGIAIAAAVGLAQLGDPPRARPATTAEARIATPVATVPTAATATAPTPGVATAVPLARDGIPARLKPADLARALHDGSLDGRLVFVDGLMRVTPVRCRSLKEGWRGCVDLEVPGLAARVWAGDAVRPWPGDPSPRSLLVTVARTDGLVYLGALSPDVDRVAGLTALDAALGAQGTPEGADGALYEVSGSLVPLPRRICPGSCAAAAPFLVDKLGSTGELLSSTGIPVEIEAGSPEVDQDSVVVQGTFLIGRSADGEGWRVVARYLPDRSIRVIAP